MSTPTRRATGSEVVPIGPASAAGFSGTVLLAVLAAIDAIAGDRIDADTKFLVGSAVATLIVTVGGRMFQAALAKINPPKV